MIKEINWIKPKTRPDSIKKNELFDPKYIESLNEFKDRIKDYDLKKLENELNLLQINYDLDNESLKVKIKKIIKANKKLKLYEKIIIYLGLPISITLLLLVASNIIAITYILLQIFSVGLLINKLMKFLKILVDIDLEELRIYNLFNSLKYEKITHLELLIEKRKLELEERSKEKINNPNIDLFDDLTNKINKLNKEEDKDFFRNILIDLLKEYTNACNNYKNIINSSKSTLMAISLSKTNIDKDLYVILNLIEENLNKLLKEESNIDSTMKDISIVLRNLNSSKYNKEFNLEVDSNFKDNIKLELENEIKEYHNKYSYENIRNSIIMNNIYINEDNVNRVEVPKIKVKSK